jgi:hypothetical protein
MAGAAAAAGQQRHDGGEVAARAVTHDRQPSSIGTEILGVRDGPPRGVVAVLSSYRERVLGRQSVVHRDDDDLGSARQPGAEPFGSVRLAGAKSAAVEIEHERQYVDRTRGRPVHPERQDGPVLERCGLDVDEDVRVRFADDESRARHSKHAVAPVTGRSHQVIRQTRGRQSGEGFVRAPEKLGLYRDGHRPLRPVLRQLARSDHG